MSPSFREPMKTRHFFMDTQIILPHSANFDFRQTIISHGWYQLAPFHLDRETWTLKTVLMHEKPVSINIRQKDKSLEITSCEPLNERLQTKIIRDVTHIFRFDDNLEDFYKKTGKEKSLKWINEQKAGRLLRSPTVFEDLVKTICTTNCSWALTKIMVSNLVEKLGKTASDGAKAFPTPHAMAQKDAEFFREEIRAGYRADYFVELAQKVAAAELDVEKWLDAEIPTVELKKEMKKIKGVGNYAAENMLKLLGRYDGLALDSYLRGSFYKKHNKGNICGDKQIELHYEKFGNWRGLAIWYDMAGE